MDLCETELTGREVKLGREGCYSNKSEGEKVGMMDKWEWERVAGMRGLGREGWEMSGWRWGKK